MKRVIFIETFANGRDCFGKGTVQNIPDDQAASLIGSGVAMDADAPGETAAPVTPPVTPPKEKPKRTPRTE